MRKGLGCLRNSVAPFMHFQCLIMAEDREPNEDCHITKGFTAQWTLCLRGQHLGLDSVAPFMHLQCLIMAEDREPDEDCHSTKGFTAQWTLCLRTTPWIGQSVLRQIFWQTNPRLC